MYSIVVVTYNSENCIYDFIKSVKENSPADVELIIIDNSDKDYGLPFVIKNKRGSYPSGLNQGISTATYPCIVCCNPDIIVTPGWLEALDNGLCDYDIVGPISDKVSGIQGAKFPGQIASIKVKFLIGFCFMLSMDTYKKIGPFDEQFTYEQDDLDYSIRAHVLGLKLGVVPCFIQHICHQSADASAFNEKRWESFYAIFKKYPDIDFVKTLGTSWPADWLKFAPTKYPSILSIPSYRRLIV